MARSKQSSPQVAAIEKFYELNDDLEALRSLNQRILFEFLRTKPTLSTDEIEMIWSFSELLSDLTIARHKNPSF